MSNFVRTCDTCQRIGKPNQVLKPAPLRPIVTDGNPFDYLVIDCVGPLPPSKTGYKYLLTIMCQTTRYPAAYPLRSITTKLIIKALTQFISIFGIPKVIQSDQGSNFTSKLFAEVLGQLKICHNVASAYHAQSQGSLERFHSTLKSLLRAYCVELGLDWEEGLPWLMLAAREVNQESLGFSPNQLVFAHKVRSPLTVLRDIWVDSNPPPKLSDYVHGFRRRLVAAVQLAGDNLGRSQLKMKRLFDRRAEPRTFSVGDRVLALLPVSRSPFEATYVGPFEVLRCKPNDNYIICTPGRRRSTQLCHVNLLKPYYSRDTGITNAVLGKPVALVNTVACSDPLHQAVAVLDEDDCIAPDDAVLRGRLKNSQSLHQLEKLLEHLQVGERNELIELINEFSMLFGDTPSRTNILYHDIDVGEAQPIRQRFYRVPQDKRRSLQTEVQYLIDNKLAQPSGSSWSSPCLLVKKPDGTFRFCTDYRKVNAITKPDSFPLPRIEDCVDMVGSAKFFTKLDLLKGYWQVPLSERAREISAFITPDGLYTYNVMSFGLRNAPATFQRLMNGIVSGLEGCAVYLDDVVVVSDSWEQHLLRLRGLFCRLAQACLTVHLAKCEFARATVTYLGKIVGQGQVRPLRAKVQAIDEFPPPITKKELMRFLGMVGYYRNFCRNFSTVVAPLTNLLKANASFIWSAECENAFQSVKILLTSAPVLAAPRLNEPFKLHVDASKIGAGAVLLQEDDNGIDRSVGFFSRKFKVYQLNYSTIEKEALALVWGLQHFEVYVCGSRSPVVIYCDHNPLTFLNSLQNPNQRLMRWSLFLQPFSLEIRHIRGTDNVIADALSRAPL